MLLTSPEHIPTTTQGSLGQFNLIQEIYKPIGEYFQKNNYAPVTLAEIENNIPELNYNQISNALTILCHLNITQPCFNEPTDLILKQLQDFNLYTLEQASFHPNYQVLANPYSGIGITTDHFSQLSYPAHFIDKLKSAKQFAEYVHKNLLNLNLLVLNEKGELVKDKAESLKIIQKKRKILSIPTKLKLHKH